MTGQFGLVQRLSCLSRQRSWALSATHCRRCFSAIPNMASSGRTYDDAIDALNSLQTPLEVIEARRKAGIKPDAASIQEMKIYLKRIGYTPADLAPLNIVHVAGTKGKGSTCAFVDSILAQYRQTKGTPSKTGLFISPHLIAVRERIRINGAPISEDVFAKYFFDVWDRLAASTEAQDVVPLGTRPIYARYLTLMSWHVFLQEGVDAAVYETGIGGEYDATNIVQNPVATGISTLGIDHTYSLGNTIDSIAWHKAGIMKPGAPAFTIHQVPEAAQVLRDRAQDKGVSLTELAVDTRFDKVAIKPDALFQKKNATLAVALADTVLQKFGIKEGSAPALAQGFVDGLEKTVFRGRCEITVEDRIIWHVDGAHQAESLKVASQWFAEEATKRSGPRILIFNQQGRPEAANFLAGIFDTVSAAFRARPFDHIIFCTNVTYAATGYKRDFVNKQVDPSEIEEMTVQQRFADEWLRLDPGSNVQLIKTIEEAVDYVRHVAGELKEGKTEEEQHGVSVFVTGSLHLVGGALGIIEKADAL